MTTLCEPLWVSFVHCIKAQICVYSEGTDNVVEVKIISE